MRRASRDARVTTCHKKRTFKDLISCGFHNLKINMAHVVKCSNGLREACNMLFLREQRKLNIKINVQLTILQIKKVNSGKRSKGISKEKS